VRVGCRCGACPATYRKVVVPISSHVCWIRDLSGGKCLELSVSVFVMLIFKSERGVGQHRKVFGEASTWRMASLGLCGKIHLDRRN
jgi:hypothetical protein